MKTKLTFILFFSFCLGFFSRERFSKTKYQYKPNFTVGIDVLNGVLSTFSDRKLFQKDMFLLRLRKIFMRCSVGFEKNIYQKNGYDATANGIFGKLGGYYMLSIDSENPDNGFYAGAKWQQVFTVREYKKVPTRGFGGGGEPISCLSIGESICLLVRRFCRS